MITRRDFARIAVSGAAAAARIPAAQTRPLAVQLYSVRALAKADLAGVLAKIAKLGYQGVEFAGYYAHSAPEIRTLLKSNGLKVAGSHIAIDKLLGDELPRTLDFNRAIGNRNLILPGVPKNYRESIAAWKETGKLLSEIAAKVKPSGFVVGYHNHNAEFQSTEGELPFDALFGAGGSGLKIQLDVGHALQGGADPVAVLEKHKGRIISVHIKDYSAEKGITGFGDGAVQWKAVFSAIRSDPGIEWCISEEEGKGCEGYGCIESSIERIRRLIR